MRAASKVPLHVRKRRRRKSDEAAGPRLVRGRGIARRRFESPWPSRLVYLCLAAAGMIVLFKYFLVPVLSQPW